MCSHGVTANRRCNSATMPTALEKWYVHMVCNETHVWYWSWLSRLCCTVPACLSVCHTHTHPHTRTDNFLRIFVFISWETRIAEPVVTGSVASLRTPHGAAGRSIRRSPSVRPPAAAAFGTLTDRGTPVIAAPNYPLLQEEGVHYWPISLSLTMSLCFINQFIS